MTGMGIFRRQRAAAFYSSGKRTRQANRRSANGRKSLPWRRPWFEHLECRHLLATVGVQFEFDTLGGTPVSSLSVGQDYLLKTLVQDVRSTSHGVYQGWLNVDYNSVVSVNGAFTHGDHFNGSSASGSTSTGHLIEIGGDSTDAVAPTPTNAVELLFSVPIHANSAGTLTLTPSLSGNSLKQFLMFQSGQQVPLGEFSFSGESITISAAAGPQVTAVSSTKPSGSYGAGTLIPITVAFDAAVTVTGTPQLTLNDGAVVNYTSGSGTNTLTFNYTVAGGQNTANLDYASTSALALNGGTIKDAGANNANLTLPATATNGLAQAHLVIDTISPAVTGVSTTTATGTYGTGAVIPITVTFNEAVTVTGTPRLTLNDGAVVNYTSGSGTSTLTFNYTVAGGQNTANLDYSSTSALSLNGGTIKDTAANSANLTLPATSSNGLALAHLVIDTTSPAVTSVSTTTPTGTYGVGAVIPITVTFNETVTVTGTPRLALNDGAVVDYTSGSGTNTLTFTYTVAAGQNTANLDYASTSALSLNSGTIKDSAANNANLTLPATGSNGLALAHLVIDTTSPAVASVSTTTPTGTYGAGTIIPIRVTFNQAVTVTGTPQLTLNDGAVVDYASGSGTSTLTFNYTVAAGQNTANLDYSSTSALGLNGGTIKNAASADAALTLPATGTNGLAQTHLVIDTTSPAVTGISTTTATGTYGIGATIPIKVNFNEAVTVTGTPQLTLNDGAVVNYTSGSGTNTLTFNYTVAGGQNTANLDYSSTTALGLNGGTIKDAGANNASLTLPATGTNGLATKPIVISTTVDAVVTQVATSAPHGVYVAGQVIPITVTFNVPVTVTGTPQLALNDGGVASYSSGSGTNRLTFNYTVAAGQNTSDLDYASTSALGLNGGTIKDAATNNAILTLPATGTNGLAQANLVIDTNTVLPDKVRYRNSHTPTLFAFANSTDPVTIHIGGITDPTVDFTLDATFNGTLWEATVPPEHAMPDGYYIFTATSSQQGTDSAVLIIDTATPTVTVNPPQPQITNQATPTISGTISDPVPFSSGFGANQNNVNGNPAAGLVTVKIIDSGSQTVQSLTATLTPTANGPNWSAVASAPLVDGTYSVQVTAIDDAANQSNVAMGTLIVDRVAPTVSTVFTPTATGTYGIGTTIPIKVTFSEPINVTGTPQLTLNNGAVVDFSGMSDPSTLTFNYTVAAGQSVANLDYASTTALSLNGGTIKDPATNDADLTLPPLGTNDLALKHLVIDTTVPSPTTVGTPISAGSTFTVAGVVPITVTFDENVFVTGSPQLTLNDGGVASYSSGSGTNTLTFTYTVAAGQNTADLDYVALVLNGGHIRDAAGNDANPLPSPGSSGDQLKPKNIFIDTAKPSVTLDPPNPLVTNNPTPMLSGTVGDPDPSSGITGVKVFLGRQNVIGIQTIDASVTGNTWKVTVPSALADGTYIVTVIATDRAGNVSDAATGSLTVDTVKPTVTIKNTPIKTSNPKPTITGTVDDASPSSGIANVMVTVDGETVTATLMANNMWSATLQTNHNQGTYDILAVATDNAGNTSNQVIATNGLMIDTMAPVVTMVGTPDPAETFTAHKASETVSISVMFNEIVNVTGTPQLRLISTNGPLASYTTGNGTTTLTFRYIVAAGDNTADLDYASTTALVLNGGTIKDLAGNDADRTLPDPGNNTNDKLKPKNIVIDTVAPTATVGTPVSAGSTFTINGVVSITLTFGENVFLTGSPQLTLNSGSGAVAINPTGSGTNTLTFTYTVAVGQNTADLDYVALVLNGGHIRDAAGNDAIVPSPGSSGDQLKPKNIVIATMLNGNVTAVIAGHDLKITGDALANNFTLTQPGGKGTDFVITGNAGTQVTFNGTTTAAGTPVTLTGSGVTVTHDVKVKLLAGDDTSSYQGVTIPHNLAVDGGAGFNTTTVTSGTNGGSKVGGDVEVKNKNDGSHTEVSFSTITGDVEVNNGKGGNNYTGVGHNTIRGDVEVEDGSGDSTTTIDNNTISGKLAVGSHGGADTVAVTSTTVDRKTTIDTGTGTDHTTITGSTFVGTVTIIDAEDSMGTFTDGGGNTFPAGSPKFKKKK
jgi:hypothetical protein